MNLTKQQKYKLHGLGIFECASLEHDGKAYYIDNGEEKEFVIPSFDEVLQTMFESILNAGFTTVKKCDPLDANCVIRVFQKLHHEHDWGMCFNVYGVDCYTKMNGLWVTHNYMGIYPLNSNRHLVRIILLPDENVYFNTDFLDCYVKIS